MKKDAIADIFDEIALILEFKGESPFKVNAYRKGARVLRELQEDLDEIRSKGSLKNIPGIGEALAKKIIEYLETGKISKHLQVKAEVPDETLQMMQIPGLGPKTAWQLYSKMNISNIDQLREALEAGKLRDMPGMGPKKEENLLKGLKLLQQARSRLLLGTALPIAEEVMACLREKAPQARISMAGSLRRMKETIGDIDILAERDESADLIKLFTSLPMMEEILAAGTTKASVRTKDGVQVDLRVVPRESYGAALQYFTGSKAHNVKLRDIARRSGLKMNEYGMFRGDELIGGRHEDELYEALGLEFIAPELREDRGEIEAASQGKLPKLIEYSDIKGDLHVHSLWSDGIASIEMMAKKAASLGYEYIAITDHSTSLKVARGLSKSDLAKQLDEIRGLQKRMGDLKILSGAEVDILADGSLDYPDEVLEKLDVVAAAVHSGFKQDKKAMTARIAKAIQNPNVDIVAHPSGRLLSGREPYEFDLESILIAAAKTGCAIELNAFPDRLDLTDLGCRIAKEKGVKVVISTDAHRPPHLDLVRLGVATARRGWLEKDDILNARGLDRFLKWLEEKA